MTGHVYLVSTGNSIHSRLVATLFGLLLFLAFVVVSGVQCSSYCAACKNSIATCNPTSGVCSSNCHRTRLCEGANDLCLATWRWKQNRPMIFTGCFPLAPFSNSSRFGSECKATILNGTRTCLCQGNHCNRHVSEPVRKRIVFRFERTGGSRTGKNNFSEESFKRGDQNNLKNLYQVPNNKYSVSWLWLSVPVVLLLFSIAGRFYRSKDTERQNQDSSMSASNETNVFERSKQDEMVDVTLETAIAQGGFATVWRARMRDQIIAVKMFSNAGISSWQKELGIYSTLHMGHSSVLKMISMEKKQGLLINQFWLATEFCDNGSLRQYLRNKILSWSDVLKMASGITSGVAFLHSDSSHQPRSQDRREKVMGTSLVSHGSCCCKVPVAHRDLKSSNVLVRQDGSCVISDFGLAVSLNVAGDQSKNIQSGTYRYMSPEELQAAISLNNMDAFKQMDVYSMGLVLWEIISRCVFVVTDPCKEYQLPYEDTVGADADLDNMIQVVAVKEERPRLNWQKAQNEEMQLMSQTLQECWDRDPEARLTADCARMRINHIFCLQDRKYVSTMKGS